MTPLSVTDNVFLMLEKRQQPTHIAGLQLFDFPQDADDDFVTRFGEKMRHYTTPVAPFDKRLTYRLGQPYWVKDKQFDLEHHFRHVALPHPGRIRELLALVSAEHSNLLDRQRPLWESYLIEGLQGRRFAVYTKQHHSLMDGVSAMRLGMSLLSPDQEQRDMPPVWAYEMPRKNRARPQEQRITPFTALTQQFKNAQKQITGLQDVVRAVAETYERSGKDPEYTGIFQAPQCVLNDRITGSRRFAAQSYSLVRIRRLCKAYSATVNDIVLAICGSALRDYLLELRALPEQPLITAVPVSLRQDDSVGGNEIVTILANLATDVADPARRVEIVKQSVAQAKQRMANLSQTQIMAYSALAMAPAALQLMTGIAPKWQAFNVLISNVPGPQRPMYWNGARLRGMYPVSMPMDRLALNITILSYCDHLEFGLTACRRTMPSMQRMLTHLESAIEKLEIAASLHHACNKEESLELI